jgi:hypothetical protein
MNKMLKSLLVAALALSAAHVKADGSHTNKTYLNARAQGVNAPMAWSTFGELVKHKGDDRFGASVAVTGFWQRSVDGKEQGSYFLANNKSTVDLQFANPTGAASTVADLDGGYVVHVRGAGAGLGAALNVSLDPRQEVYGARLDYHQDLRKLLKGLYLHAELPVVHVENNVRLNVNSTNTGVAETVAEYFAGDVVNAGDASNKQEALKYGKVNGKQSETGVADIDLSLGYNFVHTKKYSAGVAVALTVPTGNESKGVYLFEPIVGNGKHLGLGGDLHAGATVWSSGERDVRLCGALKYRYLFENKAVRTLGLKDRNLGQYLLLGQTPNGAAGVAGAALVPAANVTTMSVDVTPGSQLEGAVSVAYNHGNFNFHLGYDMYFREAESLTRKGTLAANTFGIANRNFDTAAAFGNVLATSYDGATPATIAAGSLSNDSLDVAAAATPSQFTNSINGSAGYVFRQWDCPLMLGVGAQYEWANKNSALSTYGAWLKAGLGF